VPVNDRQFQEKSVAMAQGRKFVDRDLFMDGDEAQEEKA
jgi:hypothetical protein